MDSSLKYFPPPVEPASSAGRDAVDEWFAALRAVDAEVSQHAVGIASEHFARAGVEAHPKLAEEREWSAFGLYLSLSLMPIIDKGGDLDWVRNLFSELVDFSLLNPAGSPESRLAQLLAQFIQWEPDYDRRRKVTALLPGKADAALKLVAEYEDEEQRRKEEGLY